MKFVLVTGPPAVGKMRVGQELAARMGFRLFHNHASIEFALQLFDFGSPGFGRLNEGLRQLVFETVSQSRELPGFIFTLVWAFDEPSDWDYVADLKARFQAQGWDFFLVELYAPLEVRAQRNESPDRLAAKPSKRDPEIRRNGLYGMEKKYQMSSQPGQITEPNFLHLDNTELSPEATAERIIGHFGWEMP